MDPTPNAPLLSARPEVGTAPKAKAIGEGPSSRLPTRMRPGLTWGRKFIMSPCPRGGLKCRFAALALTLPSSKSYVRTYELKYNDQILYSLRKRANDFGFDLVELPKAA